MSDETLKNWLATIKGVNVQPSKADIEFVEKMTIHHTMDDLVRLHEAIQNWSQLATDKLEADIERMKAEMNGTLPDFIFDGFGDQAFMNRSTERTLYASLAVSIATAAESTVDRFCKTRGLFFVRKDGTPIDRPDWGIKKTTLEKSLGIDFTQINGFQDNKRARILGNCFKHCEGRASEELWAFASFQKDEEIEYEVENWGKMIMMTKRFLFLLFEKVK